MTKTTTHTTNRTKQPTPAPCPVWCSTHQTVGEDETATFAHEGRIASVETLDAEYIVRPIFYSALHGAGTEISLDICEEPRDRARSRKRWAETFGMTIAETQLLINALLDAVNQTLPVEEQQFLGPPGFEYVSYDAPWA
jgi:hypothetical protein